MLNDKFIKRDGVDTLYWRLIYKLRKLIAGGGRKLINNYIKETLSDVNSFSLFTNNCLGGYFYHDAGRQFTSPTINLAFDGEDYIKFLEDPKKYLYGTFKFIDTDLVKYPVAQIDDVEVRFVHYKTHAECIDTWKRRTERIDWNNLFVIATDHDGMKRRDLLERFDKLPYKNKIMFLSDDYPQYEWAYCVKQFKGRFQCKILTNYGDFKGHRYYEMTFDIAKWIKDNSK